MTSFLGTTVLTLCLPLAIFAMLAPLLGQRIRLPEWTAAGTHASTALAWLLSLAAALLVLAFLGNDFSIAYVAGHSSRSLGTFYKIAGLWAGLDGSLLFWVWILSLLSAVTVSQLQRRMPAILPVANAVLMLIIGFFIVMLLFPANPFTTLSLTPADGQGLNPLLQNPYMVIHPPSLYMGYVSAAVPFALAMGAVVAREDSVQWLKLVRPWIYLCWSFLTLGNLLGMHWAYVELGWGGFWAWDPVENAAAMPWFTATAFLHSAIVQEKRGLFRKWNIVLLTLTCLLTIFGTYLTRSGVVQSVHAFSDSTLGPYFIVLMITVAAIGLGLPILCRRRSSSRVHLDSFFSREGLFLLNNIMLVAAAAAIIVGTMLPTISEALTGDRLSVGPPFFNRMMAPVGVAILALMGVGPLANWTRQALLPLLRRIAWAAIVAAIFAGALYMKGDSNLYVVTILATVVFATLLTLHVLFTDRKKLSQRQFGGYIVHLGVFLAFVAFAGAVYQSERTVELKAGEGVAYKGYVFTFEKLNYARDAHKEAMSATVAIARGDKLLATRHPAHHLYTTANQPSTEVDIYRSLSEDVYLILGGFDYDKQTAQLKIMINPLINGLWLGGLVMLIGTAWILWPRRKNGQVRNDGSVERHAAR